MGGDGKKVEEHLNLDPRVEPLLTPEEVQRVLRIGPDAFRKLVRLDELPVTWIGSLIRVQPGALQAWVEDKARCRKQR